MQVSVNGGVIFTPQTSFSVYASGSATKPGGGVDGKALVVRRTALGGSGTGSAIKGIEVNGSHAVVTTTPNWYHEGIDYHFGHLVVTVDQADSSVGVEFVDEATGDVVFAYPPQKLTYGQVAVAA